MSVAYAREANDKKLIINIWCIEIQNLKYCEILNLMLIINIWCIEIEMMDSGMTEIEGWLLTFDVLKCGGSLRRLAGVF